MRSAIYLSLCCFLSTLICAGILLTPLPVKLLLTVANQLNNISITNEALKGNFDEGYKIEGLNIRYDKTIIPIEKAHLTFKSWRLAQIQVQHEYGQQILLFDWYHGNVFFQEAQVKLGAYGTLKLIDYHKQLW